MVRSLYRLQPADAPLCEGPLDLPRAACFSQDYRYDADIYIDGIPLPFEPLVSGWNGVKIKNQDVTPMVRLLLFALCILVLPAQAVRADDTGLKTATSIVSAGAGWSNFTVARINSNNSQYATNNSSNQYGVISTFAFGIASEKIIDGVEVQLDGSSSSTTSAVAYAVQLSWNAGVSWTTAKVGAFSNSTDANHTLGGVGDNWGRTWTASEFSDANFQLRVYKTGGSALPPGRSDPGEGLLLGAPRKDLVQLRNQRDELDGTCRGDQHHGQGLGRRWRRRWRRIPLFRRRRRRRRVRSRHPARHPGRNSQRQGGRRRGGRWCWMEL